jgi:hypothetical protein
MSIYTYKDRLWLYEQMKQPSEDDCRYILTYLKKNDETYTENSNGVFIDLEGLSDRTIDVLMMYYKYVKPMTE